MKPSKLALQNIIFLLTFISLITLPLACTRKGNENKGVTSPEKVEIKSNSRSLYRCPMHPQVQSPEPGECPICHMKLQKVNASATPESIGAKTETKNIKYYRNPMNPSIHSDHPTKDSMGMDYIPVYKAAANDHPGESVKELGRGSFSLTPEQIRLSGTSEFTVERRDLITEIRVPGRVLGGARVSFQAFEQDSALLKVGMDFEAETPVSPGQILRGRITFVDSILDPMTRTLRVDGSLASAIKGGIKTEASMIGVLKSKFLQVLAVPEEAVLHAGARDLVYISDGNGGFSPRVVVLGIKAGGYFEVKSGLNDGEKISSGPNFLLDSESKIEFTP